MNKLSCAAVVFWLMTTLVTTNVCAESMPSSAQLVQGKFASGADEVSFEHALKAIYGPSIKINHPQDLSQNDGAPQDQFGYSVAISGDTALVGAPRDTSLAGTGSVYVFTRSGNGWSQQGKLTAIEANGYSGFGSSLAFEGDTAVIGAPFSNTSTGAAYVFARTGNVWNQQAKLTANDASGLDRFGSSTALSGDTILVGASYDDLADAQRAGSAYVFVRVNTGWQQQAKLVAANGISGDYFGGAVTLSGDTAVVGAPRADSPNAPDVAAGSAYVFVRSGATWSQQARLLGSYAPLPDYFGRALAISGDTILVGATGQDVYDLNTGSVYLFSRSGTSWIQQTQLFPSDTSPGRGFGASVALSGTTAIVGSYGGNPRGSTHVYTRTADAWTLQSQLIASDAAFHNTEGYSVAISGTSILVGTALKTTPGVSEAGAVSTFNAIGASWFEQAQLTAGDGAGNDEFGISVALSGDTALVGAYLDDNSASNAGSAFIFVRAGSQWLPQFKLISPEPQQDGWFGYSVALEGDIAVVGAPRDRSSPGVNAGAAYVFVRNGPVWLLQAALNSEDAAADDFFGYTVAISGSTAAVGAPQHDLPAALDAGAAYVFTRSGLSWSQQRKLVNSAAPIGFGISVAFAQADTPGAAIWLGAPFHQSTITGNARVGAVYTFPGDLIFRSGFDD